MLGGKVSLRRREPFSAAKTTEIAKAAHKKKLFSGWDTVRRLCRAAVGWAEMRLCRGVGLYANNGDTIINQAHTEIGTITNLSIIERI